MAYADVGGAVTELVVTCTTPSSGTVNIAKGDAVKLTGNYEVNSAADAEDAVFGQAMAEAKANGALVPVRVRGVCTFKYSGSAPAVNGLQGIVASSTDGQVKAPASGNGKGVNMKVNSTAGTVDVLL